MYKLKPKLFKVLERFFYLKLYFSRSQSYFGWFSGFIQKFILIMIGLKVYGITNYFLVGSIFIVLIIVNIFIGKLDVKYRVAHLETKVNLSINPLMTSIYNKTTGKKWEKIK